MSSSSFPVGKYLIPSLVLGGILYLLFKVHTILLPFVLGGTLAYLLSPLVRFFEVRGLRRQPVAIVVFILLLATFTFGTYTMIGLASRQAANAAQELPNYVARGQRQLQELHRWAARPSKGLSSPMVLVKRIVQDPVIMEQLNERGRTLPDLLLKTTSKLAGQILPMMELLLLVPLIAFLLLMEGPALLENFLSLVSARYVEMFLNIIFEIDNSMGQYIRGLCIKSVLVGLVALGGYWLIGLDYSIQMAVLAALTNVIPALGPLLAGVVAVIVAFFQWGTFGGILKVVVISLGVRLIDDGILQVVVFKNSVELHPIWIIFSLMAGGALWGFWGLLFGVPLACMLKVLLEVVWEWYRSEYSLRHDPLPAEVAQKPLI